MENDLRRKTKFTKDNYTIIEEERKVADIDPGSMIGELAMLDPSKKPRAKSAMAKTDCVFLLLNHDAFEILVKVKSQICNPYIGKNEERIRHARSVFVSQFP